MNSPLTYLQMNPPPRPVDELPYDLHADELPYDLPVGELPDRCMEVGVVKGQAVHVWRAHFSI